MRLWSRYGGVMAAAGVLAFALAAAAAETCTLELKRLESPRGGIFDEEMMYRYVQPQHYFMQILDGRDVSGDQDAQEFAKLVKKEPAAYNSKHPLKRVARLGTAKFAFVVDSTKKESKKADEENGAQSFDRLYFDRNHNGDLTDDKPIDLSTSPRVDLKVPVGEQEIDYSIFLAAYGSFGDDDHYVSVSLQAAAYRTGEITLDGKKHRLVLLDFNSNGRFDDAVAIPKDVTMADGGVYSQPGDKLWIDPQPMDAYYWRITAGSQQYVSKLLNVGGTFYDMKITPAGDKLTLTPATVPTGQVTNGNHAFTAVVYNDDGVFLKIDGGKDRPARLPVGDWKLLEYGIDATGQVEQEDRDAKAKAKSSGLLRAFAKAVIGSVEQSAYTAVSARGTAAYKPVKVRAGQSTELPFGPPYRPVVKAGPVQEGVAYLQLEIVGSTGEVCEDLTVRGSRPKAPRFTIATKDGKEVASGAFEYG